MTIGGLRDVSAALWLVAVKNARRNEGKHSCTGFSSTPFVRLVRMQSAFLVCLLRRIVTNLFIRLFRIPLSAFIVEDMTEFVEAHASYRFVLQDEEEEKPRILVSPHKSILD